MTGVPETSQSAESAQSSLEFYCEDKDTVTAGQGVMKKTDICT